MKLVWIGFVAAFLAGYTVVSSRSQKAVKNDFETGMTPFSHSSSGRSLDAVDVYQELMLDEDEAFEFALQQAKRIADLLGLAEKMNLAERFNWGRMHDLAAKIASLNPEEALRYYETFPTDVSMNKRMLELIVEKWGELDFVACMSYLANNPNIRKEDFAKFWANLANGRVRSHPHECIDLFQQFSVAMQRDLIMHDDASPELLKALTPVMQDEQLVSETVARISQKIQRSQEQEREEDERIKNIAHRVPGRAETLTKQWENKWPAVEEIVENLRTIPFTSERRNLLKWVMQPRRNTNEPPDEWLERITALMREEVFPASPPEVSNSTHDPYDNALLEWLPQQPHAWQRAWADEMVHRQKPAQALDWIEKLATESLRHDMRDLAWERWVATSAREAAPALMKQATPDEQEIHLPDAVYGWAMWDYTAAKAWLDAQPDSPAKVQALEKISGR